MKREAIQTKSLSGLRVRARGLFRRALLLMSALIFMQASHAQRHPDLVAGEFAYRQGDVRAAISKLRPIADAGNAAAQALLGEILDRADRDDEAVNYYRKSAEQGNSDGAYGLASALATGEGIPKNFRDARGWFEKAALSSHEGAIRTLALAYIEGGLAFSAQERESAEALKWILKAANGNVIPAVERLAKAYRTGAFGLSIDTKMADSLDAKARSLRGIAPLKGKKNANKSN